MSAFCRRTRPHSIDHRSTVSATSDFVALVFMQDQSTTPELRICSTCASFAGRANQPTVARSSTLVTHPAQSSLSEWWHFRLRNSTVPVTPFPSHASSLAIHYFRSDDFHSSSFHRRGGRHHSASFKCSALFCLPFFLSSSRITTAANAFHRDNWPSSVHSPLFFLFITTTAVLLPASSPSTVAFQQSEQ